jgi:hypothetical protein
MQLSTRKANSATGADRDPRLRQAVVSGIVEIGRKLVEVKERVEHGRYTAFVTERLGWSMQSALNFTRVYEVVKSTKFVDLDTLSIDASSLYLIAAPSTPEEARQEVLDKAAKRRRAPRRWIAGLRFIARYEP